MIINRIIPLISAYFGSGLFMIAFVYIISLAFVATVPIIIRSLITIFTR